jgi:sodium transport system ATP-binding protein
MNTGIQIQGLTKTYRAPGGPVPAVRGIDLSIEPGETVALLGPNGAGKSTTLRMLYGVLTPDSGSATIDGLDIRGETSAARAHLGVLGHAAGLYGNLTARENIAYFGELHGMPAEECRGRADELGRMLGMEAFLERRAKGLSQGQRIKVAIARALIHRPGNLVLDEPTNGLDVMAIRNLRDILRDLKVGGRCILFSSHVMQEVAALCDRVVIIGAGRVLAEGPTEQLREQSGAASLEETFIQVLAQAEGL